LKFFVYVLLSRSRPKRTYVGWTVNLELRVTRHNAGSGAKFTRGRKWTLIYAERHPSRSAAMRREVALKKDRAFRALLRMR
jgi:putative endonuclease